MRMKKNLKKALVVSLACAMVASTVPAYTVSAATAAKTAITVSNKRTVLVAGRTYNVKTVGATAFKSSNTSVATVSKTGKITPKATGYVTITATVDGKKVTTQFLCVSKTGTTSSQGKVDKMLAAPNVKYITIKNAKSEETYIIKKGDYSAKTLVVNAPLSDVKNSGSFSKIVVKDVKNGTFTNYVKNTFEITDDDFKFVEKGKGSVIEVAEGSKGTLQVTGKDVSVSSEGELDLQPTKDATLGTITVKGGTFTFDAAKNPDVKEIVVEGKADIKIVGSTAANIPVTIQKTAEGTTLESSCSVKLEVKAKADVKLSDAAGGSVIKVANDVKADISVDKSVKGDVGVGTIGSTEVKTVTGGSQVSVAVGGVVTTTGGGAAGVVVLAGPVVETTYDSVKKETTYKLINAESFDKLTSVNVTLKSKTETVAISGNVLKYVNTLINDATAADRWKAISTPVAKVITTGITANIATTTDAAIKTVTFVAPSNPSINGKSYTVELVGTTTVKINAVATPNSKYIITKNSATQVTVTTPLGGTYVITTDAAHTYFTIKGDTTTKVIINSVAQ